MHWKLHIGIHKGTVTSRDSGFHAGHFDDHSKPLTSLEEVTICAQQWQENYRQIGYSIWFAHAVAPDGAVIKNILPAIPYY